MDNFIEAIGQTLDIIDNVTSNPYTIWGVIAMQHLYARAREINARNEVRAEFQIVEHEKQEVKKNISEKIQYLENMIWHGLDELRDDYSSRGVTKTTIHHGNDVLINKSVSDIKRDYHQALGKESTFLAKRLYDRVFDKEGVFSLCREKYIEDLANIERDIFISKIHKRAGYNSELNEMENKCIPYEFFVGLVNDIVDNYTTIREIRTSKEATLNRDHQLSILSVFKILRIVFPSRRK